MSVFLALFRLSEYVTACLRCFGLFERPMEVVLSYLMRRSPVSGVIRLKKNGWIIHLSRDPADVVTVVSIFARLDYGPVAHGSVVLDVGANIGVFCLYAAFCGARQVIAFEPCAESFSFLERNIRENGLTGMIVPHRLAVASAERLSVRFPRQSNVMNKMTDACDADDLDEVPTRTLDSLVEPFNRVDLVKLDCEGAEYEILFGAEPSALRSVSSVRVEYHQGQQQELAGCMRQHGFAPSFLTADNEIGGVVWFSRPTVG